VNNTITTSVVHFFPKIMVFFDKSLIFNIKVKISVSLIIRVYIYIYIYSHNRIPGNDIRFFSVIVIFIRTVTLNNNIMYNV